MRICLIIYDIMIMKFLESYTSCLYKIWYYCQLNSLIIVKENSYVLWFECFNLMRVVIIIVIYGINSNYHTVWLLRVILGHPV